ncbi:phage protein D [Bartonella callosciuri]|uniref:Phage protein D n=1 Tax=Bartonella callosciuri TaxID=686223 RepID=A0A840P1G0_9HYPH|nr:DUF4815 domain-containing protein [Bartonella callosciuri]MBB5074127.1 phage protein D [Bartonella callosciuri]
MKHESGLPFAIDRSVGKDEQQSVVFYGRRPFLQGGELNEVQTIIRGRHDRLGRLVAQEGDRVERADAFVNKDNQSITLTEGKIYIAGDIFPVSNAVLENISMMGRIEIGVKLQKKWVTHEDDPELLGQVPGSLAEGEPGAAREIAKLVWALKEDDQQGAFFPVYILQDGVLIDQKSPSLLEPAMQAIATYDRAHGHYIVRGCRVTALGKEGQKQVFSIQEGEANISGFKRKRLAALRYEEEEDFSTSAVPSETHIFVPPRGKTSFIFKPYYTPIAAVQSLLLTKEKTVNVTRGAVAAGRDGVPDKSITAFIKIVQGTKEFKEGTDFKKTGDTIDWAPVGDEPLPGSSYTVTYRYRAKITADKVTTQEITVFGGAIGGDIIVSYTYKLPRIDRIGLNTKGNVVYIKGVSSDQPTAPSVPDDVLSLATLTNSWLDTPLVVNDGTRVASYDEMWRYFQRVLSLDRLMQLERIKSNVDSKEPVAKKGMFADPFLDDSYRDEGFPQTGSALQVIFGYENGIRAFMGRFVVESVVSIGGSEGEILRLCGKSASMRKELKEQASEHFDNKTIGEIVETLAKRHGYQAKVSPQFSKQTLPYVIRTNQSAVDFLTRLADRMQARFLIKDEKFLFLSGDNLPSLTIYKHDCSSWEFTLEPRTQYGTIAAAYFDRSQGQQCQVTQQIGFCGPVRRLRTCYTSKEEAQAAAASESDRLCRAVSSGSLTLEGRPEIMADQPLLLQGFRGEINGPWKAATVTHRYDKQSGYITEIILEAPDKGKESNKE